MRYTQRRDGDLPIYRQIETLPRDGIFPAHPALARACPPRGNWPRPGHQPPLPMRTPTPTGGRGLVAHEVGSGTYVCRPAPSAAPPPARPPGPFWQQALAGEAYAAIPRPGRHPTPISSRSPALAPQRFRGGFRPRHRLAIRRGFVATLGFGVGSGYAPAGHIAQLLGIQGNPSGPESILITAGSQQGLSLAAAVLLSPGGRRAGGGPHLDWACRLSRKPRPAHRQLPRRRLGMNRRGWSRFASQHHPRLIKPCPTFRTTPALHELPRRRSHAGPGMSALQTSPSWRTISPATCATDGRPARPQGPHHGGRVI
jgi:hypothetical protein